MAVGIKVVFDCADPERLALFWAEALHYKQQEPPPGYASWEAFLTAHGVPSEEWNSANPVVGPDGAGRRVYFQRVPEPKIVKNRVHIGLNVGGGHETPLAERRVRVEAEVRRLVGLGAT